jgi:putative hemolysin
MLQELLIVTALLAAHGLFSGAEIAILSIRKTRLHEFVRRRDKRALAVKELRDHPERFLATVQIGMTAFGTMAGAFGGAAVAVTIADLVGKLGIPYARAVGFGLVIALIAILELIVGELVPKSLALRYNDRYAFIVGRPLLGLSHLFRPLVWFVTRISNLFLRIFGDSTTFTEARLSKDELQQLVEEAAKTGSLDPGASEIASRALGFGEVTVAEVMVPRNQIVALRREAPPDEVQRVILEEGHSRMPVFDGGLDNIVGYVVARDVLALAWEKGLVVLEDILRPVYIVKAQDVALKVLREMQKKRLQLAVVTDDHGLAGLVTIEDLIEELVGDIFSEDDQPVSLVLREPGGTALIHGWAPVRKVNRELHTDLPVGADRTTIAGLCMSLAQAIPQAGERLTTDDGTVLEIVEASPRRVRKVRIHPVQRPLEEAAPEDGEIR